MRNVCRSHFAGNLIVIGLWVLWFMLLMWVSASVADDKPFDPFEILEISAGATDREIKKAYRMLSLKYHPDKVSMSRRGCGWAGAMRSSRMQKL